VEQLPPWQLPQEERDPERESVPAFADETTPNKEKSLSDLRFPHFGQAAFVSFPIAQSFSNLLPHARHLNS